LAQRNTLLELEAPGATIRGVRSELAVSMSELEALETTVQKTHGWISGVARTSRLSQRDAYRVLRAVLHTLRDRLPVNDAAHLAAELPMLLRGLFFEGWRPSEVPIRLDRDQFMAAVGAKVFSNQLIDPVRVTRDVFQVMSEFITPGEVEKLRSILPADLRSLLPAAKKGRNPSRDARPTVRHRTN
jgi:uncharacterized protein (DUF2267 family)